MLLIRRTAVLCIFLLLPLGFARGQSPYEGTPVLIAQAGVPKDWQKDAVPRFSPDGTFVGGVVYYSPSWRQWSWKPASGFVKGKAISIAQADTMRYAPMTSALKDWNTKYGKSSSQGEKVGGHLMLITYPTGMSKDGSVVVGGYADDAAGFKSNDRTFSTADDGKDIAYLKRCFIWTKQTGFRDFWDFADPNHGMEPKYNGGNYYCAVSPDGKKAVAVTDKIMLIRLDAAQMKAAGKTAAASAPVSVSAKPIQSAKIAKTKRAAKATKTAKSTRVLPFLFLNKSFADCENTLGNPKRVEVPNESHATFTRYYPSPDKNILRIVLSSPKSETADYVTYQFARGRYPTGIAACKAIGIGAETAESHEGLVAEGGALSAEWEKGDPQNDHSREDWLTFTLPKKPRSTKINPGEISLEGEVTEIMVVKNTFALRAHAVVNADNETVLLEPVREKTIAAFATDLAGLQVGMRVRVVGRDKGIGKPLVARLVSRATR